MWWDIERYNIKLLGVTRFTDDTYRERMVCTSKAELPLRVHRMESCDDMGSNLDFHAPMAYPGIKIHWSTPFDDNGNGIRRR